MYWLWLVTCCDRSSGTHDTFETNEKNEPKFNAVVPSETNEIKNRTKEKKETDSIRIYNIKIWCNRLFLGCSPVRFHVNADDLQRIFIYFDSSLFPTRSVLRFPSKFFELDFYSFVVVFFSHSFLWQALDSRKTASNTPAHTAVNRCLSKESNQFFMICLLTNLSNFSSFLYCYCSPFTISRISFKIHCSLIPFHSSFFPTKIWPAMKTNQNPTNSYVIRVN